MTELSKELLKKIKKIEIKTRQIVHSTLSGEYQSVFKGQGISFAESREYHAGDDVRFMDWKVTARTGTPYLKVFEESRELTVLLMIDLSASSRFGSQDKTKMEVAAEIAAVLGFSANLNRDRVGLLLFSEEVEYFVPPKKGKDHIMRLLADIFYYQPKKKGTSLKVALDYLLKTQKKKAIVFIISDFLDDSFEKAMKTASKKHDIVPIIIEDVREKEWMSSGRILIEDAETGEEMVVNCGSKNTIEAFHNIMLSRRTQQIQFLKSLSVPPICVQTDKPFIKPLIQYFKTRIRS